MGKSAKKSTKVEAAVAVTAPVIASGKGKRGAEKAIEKVSAKKLKKNDGTVQAIEKLKSETKTKKKNIKKKESSSSEDESSEEEAVKAVKPSTKNPTVATNGSAKKDKPISSSDSDSSDDSESEKDTKPKGKVIAPSAKKAESSSDSSDDSDSEKDTKPKGKVIAPAKKMESSSDSDSDSSSDSDAVPKAIQGKKVASKADTSSDSSSEEEDDKKTTVAVNKSSAAAKKKDDSSSDEDDDSDDSSEDDESSKVAKVPITVSKNVPVATKDTDTESGDSSDDSESDEVKPAAKKPASANGKNSKQSEQSSEDEESSEEEDDDEDEDEKPSKGQKKNDTDVEMVDAVTPKTVKKAPQTPATPQAQSGGSKTLFVGNLPFSVEQAHVENFFKDCKVAEVRFSTDREGNFKGFGHVEFATEEDAQKALALNGEQLLGRELKLDLARERGAYTPGTEKTPFQKAGNAQGSTMFVGGIDRNGDEDEVRGVLEKHFAACGEVTRVSIPPDRESGGLRGIAYVDFTDSGSLNKALELGGPEFNGYTLKVDEAKPRDNSGSQRSFDRPSGGRGNGGRFGRSGGRDGGRFGRSGGRDGGSRSGGRFGRSGGRDGGRGNRPNLAAAGTGKKTTFDD